MRLTPTVETWHRDRDPTRDEQLVTPTAPALMLDGLDDERDPTPIRCPAWRVAGHGLTVAKRKEREESNVYSILWHTRFMAIVPAEPEPRHVWVKGASDYGPTRPGLILNWQYAPVHNATTPSWVALVLVAPFPDAVLIEWVSADRLIGIRDPSPADGH
jgi:hypothetical protein